MKIDIDRLLTFDLSRIFVLDKNSVADTLFVLSLFVAFFGSLKAWFLFPVLNYCPILASVFAIMGWGISRSLKKPIFTETYAIVPVACYMLLAFYKSANNGLNINAYVSELFTALLLFFLFSYDKMRLDHVATIFSKIVGGVLLISYPLFLLYIIGFPLPHVDMTYNDGYYYFANYFFFLVDERSLFAIIPRFQSIFLEPAYLGSMTALLLMTRNGKWKKWYNISLLMGLFLSFSLAGYAYIVTIVFLNLWTGRKKVLAKAAGAIFAIMLVIGGAFVYKGGDNMLHDLILLRLEVDDGDLVGNNRVSKSFDSEYSSYVQSADIVFGRDYDYSDFGDSGYKVFFYDYGIVGVLLLLTFYTSAFAKYSDWRSCVSAFIVMLLIFGVDGFVLWMGRLLPLYIVAMRKPVDLKESLIA